MNLNGKSVRKKEKRPCLTIDLRKADELLVNKNEYQELKPIELRQIAKDTADEIYELENKRNRSFIKLAKILFIIYENNLWKGWGFRSFMEYADTDISPVGYRSAKYMIDVYKTLVVKLNAPQERVDELGWTKGKEVSKLANLGVIDQENVSDMIEFANNTGRKELIGMVKEAKKKLPDFENSEGKKKHIINFTLPEDMYELWMTRREQYAKIKNVTTQDINDEAFFSMILLGSHIEYTDKKQLVNHWLEMLELQLPEVKFIAVDTMSTKDPFIFGKKFVDKIVIDDKDNFEGI